MKNSIEKPNEYSPSEYIIGQWLSNAKNILSKFLEKPLSKSELSLLRKFVIEGIKKYEDYKSKDAKTYLENAEWPHLFAVLSFLEHYGIELPTFYNPENIDSEKIFNPFADPEAVDFIKSRLKNLRE